MELKAHKVKLVHKVHQVHKALQVTAPQAAETSLTQTQQYKI